MDYSFFEILFQFNAFIIIKNIPSICIVSLVKSIILSPQTATFTPFISAIPVTSHFDKFGFKPENYETKEILMRNSFIESNFFKKKVV